MYNQSKNQVLEAKQICIQYIKGILPKSKVPDENSRINIKL